MLLPVVRALIEAGGDYRASLATADLRLEDLELPNHRIPHSQAIRFLTDAVERSGDPGFGLRCGQRADIADLGLMGMLLVSAPTFGDSVRRVQRFSKLLHDAANDFGEQIGDQYYWYMTMEGLELTVSAAESIVSGSVARIRFWAGPEWSPREVWFRHPAPAHARAYRDVFRCDVRFEAPHIAMVVDAELLEWGNGAEIAIAELVERRAEAALAEIAGTRTFAGRVREQVLGSLHSLDAESISAEALCRRLHVSRATLTRKLAQEDTTLSAILDGTRRDLAVEYLRNGALSTEEVARRLAFSDARAFRRAFQRWTGSSPAEFKAAKARG
jgi:AraC-like DNA-binding protein